VFADGIDNDGDGYVDDLSGWDAVNDDGDEFDDRFFGHGTGRAGIVAPRRTTRSAWPVSARSARS